jgi:hypothetical protein
LPGLWGRSSLMHLAVRSLAYAAGAIAGVGYLYLLGVKTNMLGGVGSRGERTAALLLPLPLPHCRLAAAAAATTPLSRHCSAATDAAATANSTIKLPQSGCCAAATAATVALPLPPLRCYQDAAAATTTTAPSRSRSTYATKLPRCDATAKLLRHAAPKLLPQPPPPSHC